jgi:DNA-binding transcriptional MerR regulator
MTTDERKQIVKRFLAEGKTLSEIQSYLHKEKNDPVTYMELRLLLSEMPDVTLPEKEPPKPPPSAAAASTSTSPAPVAGMPAKNASVGKLTISVDQMPQPGSMLSGFARFASGAKAHWFLDTTGRLGLDPELGSDKPTQQDMQEFTMELRRLLQSGGM